MHTSINRVHFKVVLLWLLFTADDKLLIKSLTWLKGYSSRKFLQELQQRIDKYDTSERVPGSGWPHAACTAENVGIQLTSCWRVTAASTRLCSYWRRTFWAYDVKMMWLTTRLTIFFERLAASQVCRYSTIHSNVHVITASKAQSVTNFPRWHVFQVKSPVELYTVSLSVYSGTCPPIFTEIGSYMTDTEQKKCWHVFYWDMVVKLTVKVKLQ